MTRYNTEYKGQKEEIEAPNLWAARIKAGQLMGVPKSRERFILIKAIKET